MADTCNTCAFSRSSLIGGYGLECHYHAPEPELDPVNGDPPQNQVIWPEIDPDDWCGRWMLPEKLGRL